MSLRERRGGTELNEMDIGAVQAAAGGERLMNDFIRQSEPYIFQCASGVVHRCVTKSDEEWSVALLAFSQAVKDYSAEKGGFLGFARLVIRRRLIDYMRAQSKQRAEIPVSLSDLDSGAEEDGGDAAVRRAVLSRMAQMPDDSLKLEIESAGQIFSAYGFSFYDLIDCSPKAEKTKKACAKAIACLIRTPLLTSEMKYSKCLPLKPLEKKSGVPRKILERHRKYIIAAVEIMTGDYPFLAEYMRFVREELEK